MGDTSFDVDGAVFGWFDRWLKGNTEAFPASTPKVRYYAMGENKWKASASWPPASVKMQRLYLRSDGRANSLWGNGRLDAAAPGKEPVRSEEHTSELQSLMRISYAVFCLTKKNQHLMTKQLNTMTKAY